MSTVVRPPTARASGGRNLLLLGVLLALAAGVVVLYTVSHYTASGAQYMTVVVATQNLKPGTILIASGTPDSSHVLVSEAFTTKTVNADFLANAYTYTSQDALNSALNNEVVVSGFLMGDILRTADPRLVPIGSATSGSLNLINPNVIQSGDLIVEIQLADTPAVVPGDHVDILVTLCNVANSVDPNVASGCVTQDTLKNVYVYTVRSNFVFVVLDAQDALRLKYLTETGKVELAVRGSGDSSSDPTKPVDGSNIVQQFNF